MRDMVLVLLPTNRSTKASRRLRHSLFALSHPSCQRPNNVRWRSHRELLLPTETRAQIRARRAQEARTEKMRLSFIAADAEKVARQRSTVGQVHSFNPDAEVEIDTLPPRKITGAVRRGLQREQRKAEVRAHKEAARNLSRREK